MIVACNDYNDDGEFVVPESVDGEHPLFTGTRNQGTPVKTLLVKAILKRFGSSYTSDSGEAVGGSMIMPTGWGEAVPAVLYGWYAGMEGGTALARVLFGDVSPEGKLPFTIPQREEDLPYFSGRRDDGAAKATAGTHTTAAITADKECDSGRHKQ